MIYLYRINSIFITNSLFTNLFKIKLMKKTYSLKTLLMTLVLAIFAAPSFAQDCADASVPIAGQMGLTVSPAAPFTVRGGDQDGRIFRDGTASVCPVKVYPGDFNVGTTYNWTTIAMYNNEAVPVCITVTTDVDSGAAPCTTNGHGQVYQEAGGLSMTPYNPLDQSVNFVGDVGSSVSQPFEVEVGPGWFEVLFTNTSAQDNCDFAFTITGPPAGVITCEPALGIEDSELDAFVMSPNPAQGFVSFDFPNTIEVTSVTVYDVTGKLVQSHEVDSSLNFGFDTAAIGSGVYFVTVSSESASSTKKLIVR